MNNEGDSQKQDGRHVSHYLAAIKDENRAAHNQQSTRCCCVERMTDGVCQNPASNVEDAMGTGGGLFVDAGGVRTG